jgi:hypothetical protein
VSGSSRPHGKPCPFIMLFYKYPFSMRCVILKLKMQHAAMSANSQSKSAFVTRLPREVRDAIYLELWRLKGLRQHIVSHRNHENADPELLDGISAAGDAWPTSR